MQGKKFRILIMQWLIPSILLMVLLMGILQQYRDQNEKIVNSFVENSIEQTGGTYSRNISSVLKSMKGVTDVIDEMLERRGDGNITYLVQALDAIEDSGSAFSVVYCYANGSTVMPGQGTINLQDTDYFSKFQGVESFFSYTKDDGITGNEAILYVCPVEYMDAVQGYLIAYMDPQEMEDLFKDGRSYGDEVFYAIVDVDGSIVASYGGIKKTNLLSDDFWNFIKEEAETDSSWSIIDRLRESRQFAKMEIIKDEEHRLLCQFPIEDTEWYMVMGLNQAYAQSMMNRVWNPMVGLFFKIGICLLCYLACIVVLNILTRIRNTQQRRALEDKADTDLLTELNNKIATERKIREYIAENPEKQAVFFVVDVDNFKKINDTLGHAFGDEVLRNLGIRLKSMFRVTDIIGRIGGDEFLVFLKDVRDDEFHHFEVGEYVKYSVTASIGGAVFPRDANTFEDLYKAADSAVYVSKKHGKNQLSFYHKDKE